MTNPPIPDFPIPYDERFFKCEYGVWRINPSWGTGMYRQMKVGQYYAVVGEVFPSRHFVSIPLVDEWVRLPDPRNGLTTVKYGNFHASVVLPEADVWCQSVHALNACIVPVVENDAVVFKSYQFGKDRRKYLNEAYKRLRDEAGYQHKVFRENEKYIYAKR